MPPGHLVTGLQAPLHGDERLDHFQHSRRQVITGFEFFALLFKQLVKITALSVEISAQLLQLLIRTLVAQAHFKPLVPGQVHQIISGYLFPAFQLAGPAFRGLISEQFFDAVVRVFFDDAELVVEVLAYPHQLLILVLLGAIIFFHTIPGENLNVDDDAGHTRWHAQAGVLHVGCFFTEYGAQQFLFRCELGLSLGRHLAHQDISRGDLGADIDNTGFIQFGQRGFTDIRNVAGNLLRT